MAEQFVFASMSACTATTIVHPLDVIRVKMQISKAGEGGIVERITNGPKGYRGLYAGLSAGLLRQLTYGTGRIGVYNVLLDAIGGPSVPFTSKVAVGITAGSFGGLVGNPAEVVLVRMAAGGRGYKHVCDALSRIVKEEGPSALLTGVMPTVVRAAVITSSQLATFTEANTRLKPILGLQDGVFLHFCAAMVSGAVTVAVSMPFDVVKTAMQNQKTGAEAVHASSLGCALQMVSKRGPLALWNGALPFWFKLDGSCGEVSLDDRIYFQGFGIHKAPPSTPKVRRAAFFAFEPPGRNCDDVVLFRHNHADVFAMQSAKIKRERRVKTEVSKVAIE